MTIELLEPGLAVPKGRGYVGVGDAGDDLYFPHVDSCCALVGIFKGGAIIGGHMGAQWPGTNEVNRPLSGQKVFDLMQANKDRVNAGELAHMVCVYPGGTGWETTVNKFLAAWNPSSYLAIDTSSAAGGVHVSVTHDNVTLTDCRNSFTKTFAMPAADDMAMETFPS